MILVPKEVALKEIMIDPFNPRFTSNRTLDQKILIEEMLMTKESKELLNSMREDIKWVNRIVVQKIEDHERFEELGLNNDDFLYVVVEGNTRTSCLKSKRIEGYNEDSYIPILLAEKSLGETSQEYTKQVRVTQGIANVTVVKEWSPVAKAKHLNSLFNDYFVNMKAHEVYKKISSELGLKHNDVKDSIIRFKIFSKIAQSFDPIPDENWGYLEAFDKNIAIRKLIGLNSDTMEFLKEDDEDYNEILGDIPPLIKQAVQQGINTKQFRDVINSYSKDYNTIEEFSDFIKEIIDPNSEVSLIHLKNNIKIISDKEHWSNELAIMNEKIASFPSVSDWSIECVTALENISKKVKRHITIINSSDE